MKKIIDHLKTHGVGIFSSTELNEPIEITYIILHAAVQAEADTLIIDSDYIAWYKDGLEIDRFELARSIFVLSFTQLLEIVIARDQVVKNVLRYISKDVDKTIYKIVY